MDIELELGGDVQLRRRLLRIAGWAGDPRPVFQHIARYWMAEEREQFESEGAHASGGWAELAPSTIAGKDGDTSILFDTGDLMASLTEEGDDNMLLEVNEDFLLFGTEVEYARFHQKGEGVPQRRPLELTERARRESVRMVQAYVMTGTLR